MKKKITFISFILMLSIIIISCSSFKKVDNKYSIGEQEIEKSSIHRDKIVIPLIAIDTLDPLENNSFDYYNFSKLMYDGLFEFDNNLNIIPSLVDTFDIEDDGKTVVLKLKNDIYWHNGDILTTEDVAFTIDTIKTLKDEGIYKKRILSALGNSKHFDINSSIKTNIIDDNIIEIYFDNTYSNNLEALTFPIINESSYNLADQLYTPIGTGPYKYVDYNSSEGISLIRNDNYWNGEVNIPAIQGKIFKDEKLIFTAFEDGRVDFINGTKESLEKYKEKSNIKILEYVSPEYEFLGYNFKNKLLKGAAIRQAIYYGINRQEIIEKVYLGHATQVDTPLHPNSYLIDEVINIYGHNMDKAKGLLSSVGFNYMGDDGILEDGMGNRLSFRLITNSSNNDRMKTAMIIKENLKKIGIEILLEYPKENSDNIDREWELLNKDIQDGKYDIVLLGWELSVIQDISFMFHSSTEHSKTNFIKFDDGIMDHLLELTFLGSREDKKRVYENLQIYIMENLPYGSLYFFNRLLLTSDNIEGPLSPTFFNLYRGLEKCEILETRE